MDLVPPPSMLKDNVLVIATACLRSQPRRADFLASMVYAQDPTSEHARMLLFKVIFEYTEVDAGLVERVCGLLKGESRVHDVVGGDEKEELMKNQGEEENEPCAEEEAKKKKSIKKQRETTDKHLHDSLISLLDTTFDLISQENPPSTQLTQAYLTLSRLCALRCPDPSLCLTCQRHCLDAVFSCPSKSSLDAFLRGFPIEHTLAGAVCSAKLGHFSLLQPCLDLVGDPALLLYVSLQLVVVGLPEFAKHAALRVLQILPCSPSSSTPSSTLPHPTSTSSPSLHQIAALKLCIKLGTILQDTLDLVALYTPGLSTVHLWEVSLGLFVAGYQLQSSALMGEAITMLRVEESKHTSVEKAYLKMMREYSKVVTL